MTTLGRKHRERDYYHRESDYYYRPHTIAPRCLLASRNLDHEEPWDPFRARAAAVHAF